MVVVPCARFSEIIGKAANRIHQQEDAQGIPVMVYECPKCGPMTVAATDPKTFKAKLLRCLGLDEEAFQAQIKTMLLYRDQWVAHLDGKRSGYYPSLELAKKAVWFYYAWIHEHEAHTRDLVGFPEPHQLDEQYAKAEQLADAIYRAA